MGEGNCLALLPIGIHCGGGSEEWGSHTCTLSAGRRAYVCEVRVVEHACHLTCCGSSISRRRCAGRAMNLVSQMSNIKTRCTILHLVHHFPPLSSHSALTQPDGTGQQSKVAKLPGRKSSSLSAATGLGVRKASRTQLTMDWIQKSDFKGSQEDSDNEDTGSDVQRRNVGSMWGKPQPQQHVKRRISQQLRHLNPGEDSLQQPDSPATPPEVRAKARTFDGRRSSLTRKQSYAVAVGGGSMHRDVVSLSSIPPPMVRTRSLSSEAAPTDKDVLKDFLGGGVKDPSHRMVYNFVTKESEGVRAATSGSSHDSPLTTYQESFL